MKQDLDSDKKASGNGGKPGDKPQKVTLTVVVNGTPAEIEVNQNAPLHTVIPKALHETGNEGQPPESWELKDANGILLDPDRKISEFQFGPDAKVFLSLRAGVGG